MRAALEAFEQRHGLALLTQRARLGVLIAYVSLIVLLTVGGLQLQSRSDAGLLAILIRVLPLILFLPAIVTQRARGHVWLAFVSLLYFMQGVMIATLPNMAWLGLLEVVSALLLFTASMLFARWRGRQLKQ